MPQVPFFPVEGFTPQQIVRNARDQAESAVSEKLAPLAQLADDCQEAYNEYKVYNEMSSTLSKISKKVRKNKETSKSLDKLEEQLKMVNFMQVEELKNYQVQKVFIICELGIEVVYFSHIQKKKKEQSKS